VRAAGRTARLGSYDNTIRLWDVTTGAEIACLQGHSAWVQALCPDGRLAPGLSTTRSGCGRVDRPALRLGNDRFHAAPLRWLARGRALIDPDRGTGLVSAAAGAGSPAPAADASSLPRKPKKRGPFQLVPVILRADGRQARKDLSLPAEAARDDQNLLKLALIFPDDDRADLQQALFAGAEEFANARIKTKASS
jgi:hypothetical protein